LIGTILLVCLVFLGGCDLGGGPIPPPSGPAFSFAPQSDSLTVLSTGYLDLKVESTPPITFSVVWTLDEAHLGYGRNFRFLPEDLGRGVLQAEARYEERRVQHRWTLDVVNNHPLNFAYDPADDQQLLMQQETRRFQVQHSWPFTKTFTWWHGGEVVGRDSLFDFSAHTLGLDSLRVEIQADGQVLGKSWSLEVIPYRPPPVTEALAQDGPSGGSVVIIWGPVEAVVNPIDGYLLAASFDGPVTEENWDQALFLGWFEHLPDEPWQRETFTVMDHGMVPGAQGWFAVRTQDDQGLVSAIALNVVQTLSENWWIEGVIRDELGNVLPGITVADDGPLFAVQTDASGWYRIGPFPDFLSVVLQAQDSADLWHGYRTGPLQMETGQVQDFRLVTAHGLDPACSTFDGSFVDYFMYMTRTSISTPLRPDRRLFKWDHYPLSVHVPGFTSETGIDFQANCALTLDIWNAAMGEEYLVLTEDPELADIVFTFADMGTQSNGQTSLMLPNDLAYQLGDVIPEKMEIQVNSTLDPVQRVQETALHELGHALGINRHSFCSSAGYLMYVTASGALDNGPENAIHLDERRAVRTIRYLPQGHDMEGY
jgi:hypothetical protein